MNRGLSQSLPLSPALCCIEQIFWTMDRICFLPISPKPTAPWVSLPPLRPPPATSPAFSPDRQRRRDTQPARVFITSDHLQVACTPASVASDFILSDFCPSYSTCSQMSVRLTPQHFLPRPERQESREKLGSSILECSTAAFSKCWSLDQRHHPHLKTC